jgi:hypothetical protein
LVGKSGKFPSQSAALVFLAATANSGYDASAAVIAKVGTIVRKFLLEALVVEQQQQQQQQQQNILSHSVSICSSIPAALPSLTLVGCSELFVCHFGSIAGFVGAAIVVRIAENNVASLNLRKVTVRLMKLTSTRRSCI